MALSLLDTLQIIFIVLKLTNLITWSWWLVLTPIWIQLLLFVILVVFIVLKGYSIR